MTGHLGQEVVESTDNLQEVVDYLMVEEDNHQVAVDSPPEVVDSHFVVGSFLAELKVDQVGVGNR